jgi:hypothetical protein
MIGLQVCDVMMRRIMTMKIKAEGGVGRKKGDNDTTHH